MLTAKQKNRVILKAMNGGFPMKSSSLHEFVGMVERYVDGGDIMPGDKLYPFVPDELLNIADNQ